ncbi:MAG TPA: PTS glucose transporter subunit IIA [Thermoanaerobacterales bacterium]|nr:PTS glucose transporter subunit IIA [Thermoanaerobacterales bacterium]
MFFSIFKKNKLKFVSPAKGVLKSLDKVKDESIANRYLGDGFAIEPKDRKIISPVDGKILLIFPTLHAIGIKNYDGPDILIHIGLDTVNLKGEGFKPFCQVGQEVKKGDLLMEVDFELIKAKGFSCDVIVLAQEKASFKILKENRIVECGENEIVEVKY